MGWYQINVTTDAMATNYTVALECGRQYTIEMSAWNELGQSDRSRTWIVKTMSGTFTNIQHQLKDGNRGVKQNLVSRDYCGIQFRERRRLAWRRRHLPFERQQEPEYKVANGYGLANVNVIENQYVGVLSEN